MTDLKQEIMEFIHKAGATAARVTVKDHLSGPPSADPTYLLPSARSVIAFNVALDREFIPDYFSKISRLPLNLGEQSGGSEKPGHREIIRPSF